jgi:hypothetical protein
VKKIVLSLFAAVMASSLIAQTQPVTQDKSTKQQKKLERRERINELSRQEEEGEIVFNKQHAFSIKLASDGYGIGYEIGKFRSPRKSLLYNIELSEKKHPKERKDGVFDQSQLKVNYVSFGKTNTFYQLRLGAAMQQVIGGKGNKNGVMVSAIYGGGLTLGLVKPYMVDAYDQNTGETVRTKFPEVLDSNYSIIKAKGLAGGWNQLKIRPGLYAKTAMRFDYGRLNETVTALEVGLSAEYYASKISQMLYNKDKQFFFNAYVSILLGKRK